jgi:hypothetical protein
VNRETAEGIAIQALSFLAENSDRLGRFLALTGLHPAEIRRVARDRDFLAGVLDHLTLDESLLLAFADVSGHAPADLQAAHRILAGKPWERDTA